MARVRARPSNLLPRPPHAFGHLCNEDRVLVVTPADEGGRTCLARAFFSLGRAVLEVCRPIVHLRVGRWAGAV